MIKYVLKNLPLPMELIDIIYSYIDLLTEIKESKKYRFKRLITNDFYVNASDMSLRKYCFMYEEQMFTILLKNNAHHLIKNIHTANLKR